MKAKATKTLNPLPFGDLEPHRFEDLVRQLTYDFRNWRSLEATGRLGADDGYDARGLEIIDEYSDDETDDDEENSKDTAPQSVDRIWQIQCKREKSITPAKLEKYLDEMIHEENPPYGLIFVAPCDFSKKTRDLFQDKLREKGVQEFYMWDKAYLEDVIILPKNDHLLYAYFGISLVIRRRSQKTQIRSLLTTKRKAIRHLGSIDSRNFLPVLVRDINDKHYPYSGEVADFKERPRWKKYHFVGHTHNGIKLLVRQYFAYRDIDNSTGKLLEWDYSKQVNLAILHDDHWNRDKDDDDYFQRGHAFLDKINERNQAFLEVEGIIPYERIIEIDPFGDTISDCPHLFVEVRDNTFFEGAEAHLSPRTDRQLGYQYPIHKKEEELRIKKFPKKFPKLGKPKPLPPMGSKKSPKSK